MLPRVARRSEAPVLLAVVACRRSSKEIDANSEGEVQQVEFASMRLAAIDEAKKHGRRRGNRSEHLNGQISHYTD